MKKFLCIFFICFLYDIESQNKQILYDFSEIPQTLLLNPALNSNYKFHVGLPFLSSINSEVGSSGVVLSDVFAIDGRNINDKISSVLNTLASEDFITLNTQIEILNLGFRVDEIKYLSFGFYQEVDVIGYYPKDIFTLFNEGNASNLNKIFNISDLRYKLDVLGVLHFGFSQKITDKFTFGGRFKIYSSALNLQSNNNTGTFTTVLGTDSAYKQYLDNVNINLQSAGLVKDGEYIDDPSQYLKNTFFGSSANLGLGFDVGIDYDFSPKLNFSASILDIGFVNYKKNIKNTKSKGSFVFEGVNLEYDPDGNSNYWEQIEAKFKEQLPTTEDENKYISWRPVKINAALKYSFGEEKRLLCYDGIYKDYFSNAIGVHLFNVSRPLNSQLELTAFYERAFSKKTRSKLTYTIDRFSFSNIGLGISTQISKFNLYATVDNLLSYRNLSSANNVSFHFGFNLIFN